MMNKSTISIFFLLCACVFLASCAVDSVVVKPNYDFNKIKRVAVLDFKDSSYYRDSGPMVSELFVKYLLRTGYTIVERSQLQSIMREHELSISGVLNKEQVKKFGRVSGVDALITGSISMLVPERYFYENSQLRFIAAQVGITCRMIDVETGEVLWVGSNTYDGMNVPTAFEYLISSIINQLMDDLAKANK